MKIPKFFITIFETFTNGLWTNGQNDKLSNKNPVIWRTVKRQMIKRQTVKQQWVKRQTVNFLKFVFILLFSPSRDHKLEQLYLREVRGEGGPELYRRGGPAPTHLVDTPRHRQGKDRTNNTGFMRTLPRHLRTYKYYFCSLTS